MCTLVVFAANDNANANPQKDQRGAWKKGMIVEVYEDGVCKEPPAAGSKMVFVHIPGVPKAQAEKYVEQTADRRRLFKIDWSSLPNGVRTSLRDDREITVTLKQIKGYIRDVRTNALEG